MRTKERGRKGERRVHSSKTSQYSWQIPWSWRKCQDWSRKYLNSIKHFGGTVRLSSIVAYGHNLDFPEFLWNLGQSRDDSLWKIPGVTFRLQIHPPNASMAIFGNVLIPRLLTTHCPKIKVQPTVLETHSMSNGKLCNFCWNLVQ